MRLLCLKQTGYCHIRCLILGSNINQDHPINVKKGKMNKIIYTVFTAAILFSTSLLADEIGSVDTVFKFLGPNHKIVVEAFDDPQIPGVTCYLSRAKKGGITGSLGLAEDPADASISCRQIGPIRLPDAIRTGALNGSPVFKKSISILFKKIQVVRFYDRSRNVLIYLTYSDKLIEGSPKNSISAIPLNPL